LSRRNCINSGGARRRRTGIFIILALLLGGCAHHRAEEAAGASGINAYPTNYKSDIAAGMHAYLNDPTGIRDAAIAEPVLKAASMTMPSRYVVCLRFNAKKNATVYAGVQNVAAVFLAGRFDQFVDTPKEVQELCADATYAPFPELQNLSRY
jgi:hypothetical protein